MKPQFRTLRAQQLERSVRPFVDAKDNQRPQMGWIRAIRQATGVTTRELARRLGQARSRTSALEKAEAEYRITLGSLREAAEALGCQLVYALVPKSGGVQELAEQQTRAKAAENVRAVEHSMALEDQAVGGVEEKIEEQTKRILKRK